MNNTNLLDKYRTPSSFSILDGETVILRFKREKYIKDLKISLKGDEHEYLFVPVYLFKHSSNKYEHMQMSDCNLRIGPTCTLATWLNDTPVDLLPTGQFKVWVDRNGYGLQQASEVDLEKVAYKEAVNSG
jgi:hypothetical protein